MSQTSLVFSINRTFSTSSKRIAVIGGGAGGISLSRQLIKSKKIAPRQITIFDKSETHYYQPSFTMIGGGVIPKSAKEGTYIARPMKSLIPPGVSWV